MFGNTNCLNVSAPCRGSRSNGKPLRIYDMNIMEWVHSAYYCVAATHIARRSGYKRSRTPQYDEASLQSPTKFWSMRSSSWLEIMTNKSHARPVPSVPRGTSICCGHPQPQKVNAAFSALLLPGRSWVKSRKVRSNGMVTLDSSDLRRTRFWPGLTVREKSSDIISNILFVYCALLTGDSKTIQFYHQPALIAQQHCRAAFIVAGSQENATCAHCLRSGIVVNGDLVGEWAVIQVRESVNESWEWFSQC